MSKETSDQPAVVTQEVVAADGQTADIVQIKKYDDTIVFSIDKDGVGDYITAPPRAADHEFYLDGGIYYARRIADGVIISSGATAATVYAALVAALPSGNGTVIDRATGFTGEGVCINHYANGVIYDESLMLTTRHELKPPSRVISNFDEGAGVFWLGDHVADDSVNYKRSNKSVKVTSIDFDMSTVSHTWGTAMSFDKNGCFLLRIYVDNYSNWGQAQLLMDSSGGAYTDFYAVAIDPEYQYGNWKEIIIPMRQFDPTGSPSWNSINFIRFTVYSKAGTTLNVTLDELSFYESSLERPTIIFTFDDDDDGMYANARTAMDKYGWKGVMFWITSYTTHLTEIRGLHDSGWDIGSHTYSHQDQSGVTENEAAFQFIRSLRGMKYYGLLRGLRFLAWPYASNCAESVKQAKNYFHLARSLGIGKSDWPVPVTHTITAAQCDGQSLVNMQSAIDALETGNGLWIILFHSVKEANPIWTPATFASLCDYIATKNIDVLSLSQLFEKYGGA